MKTDIFKQVLRSISDNAPMLTTILGALGVASTAYLGVTAGLRIGRDMEQQKIQLSSKEWFQRYWLDLAPVAGVAAVSVAAVLCSHSISARRNVAITTAYVAVDRAYEQYRQKAVEVIGARKDQSIIDAVAKDNVRDNPPSVIFGEGEVLCMDSYSGRYFKSSMNVIRAAVNDINYEVNNYNYASLSSFYGKIGLASTAVSDQVGWNVDRLLEVKYTTTLSDNDTPCIVLNYEHFPIMGFDRLA